LVGNAVDRDDSVATASDGHNTLAMLVRRPGESLFDILERLDCAIEAAWEHTTNSSTK